MLGIIIQLNQCLSVGTNNKFWGEPKECQTTNPNHEAMAECEPRRGHGKRTPIRKDWLENPLGRPWTKKFHLMSLGKQRQTAANPVLYIILVAVQQQQQNKTKQNKKKNSCEGVHLPIFSAVALTHTHLKWVWIKNGSLLQQKSTYTNWPESVGDSSL